MPLRQKTVNSTVIETLGKAPFPRLEVKVSPNDCPARQQTGQKDVRAKVHVVMAVEPHRRSSIEPTELFQLRRDHIFERARQRWVKHGLGQTMPPKASGDSLLMLDELDGAVRLGERGSEIQVQAGVDSLLQGDPRSQFGVLHEDHRAY